MPSTATITAFYSFTANTKARATQVNTNFSNFRGHIVAIDPNTIAASNDTYDLGSTEYRWRTGYFRNIDFKSNTSTGQALQVIGDTTTGSGAFLFKYAGGTRARLFGNDSSYISLATSTAAFETLNISSTLTSFLPSSGFKFSLQTVTASHDLMYLGFTLSSTTRYYTALKEYASSATSATTKFYPTGGKFVVSVENTSSINFEYASITAYAFGSGGNVNIGDGITNAAVPGTKLKIESSSANDSVEFYVASSGEGPNLLFYAAGGSIASPSSISAAKVLCDISFYGHAGGSYREGARIRGQINGPSTSNSNSTDLYFYTGDGTNALQSNLKVSSNGNVIIGNEVSLTAGSSQGFLHIPAGVTITAAPATTYTGKVPMYFDGSGNYLYVYSGGAWRKVALT